MDFALSPEQETLRQAARRLLAEAAGGARALKLVEAGSVWDRSLWHRMGAELGWTAIAVPEAYDGVGAGSDTLAVLLEELGYGLACTPFFATVCLAAPAILAAGDERQRKTLLPRIAAGEVTATLAFQEDAAEPDAGAVACVVAQDGEGYVLSGTKDFVVDGDLVDWLVVSARRGDSSGPVRLFLVPGNAPGVDRTAHPTLDATRRLARVRFDAVRLETDAELAGPMDGAEAVAQALDHACVALAAEQAGGARRCLDLAVEHARTRTQFGRPIGSFQAVQHHCADVYVLVESARSACEWAGYVATHSPEALPNAAALAKAYCCEAYWQAAATSLQVHGGIGFTWEHEIHLHLKRARAGEFLLGSARHHRARLATSIFDGPVSP
ncbi:MAG: acyl-CoA dehydrogenase family protein [Bradymonadia bacterium]